jgi:Domain of unknown function (DUF3943)
MTAAVPTALVKKQDKSMKRATVIGLVVILIAALSLAQAEDLRLKDDDPQYNKKYPAILPILEVPLTNGLVWSFDRYVSNASYSHISSHSIDRNFSQGFVWDTDDFPTNFSLHPYLGSAYFNCARSNGYNFYQSAPFAFGGSLMWELFMETTRPSYNDLVNTTVSGIFLGEVLYRLSSNILDDRSSGGERFGRELAATLIDPVRGFNRLMQGKMFQVNSEEVYQKEPIDLTLAFGAQKTSRNDFGSGGLTKALLNLNITYGDPFEIRSRKPFDYFHLRGEFASGDMKSAVKSAIGDAYLFGSNGFGSGNFRMLIGGFQHYDYWNVDSFQIGTIGLGGGLLTRLRFERGFFQNDIHIAGVPLGASNTRKVNPEELNPGFKNYTYSGGAEMKVGTLLNLEYAAVGAEYYIYWLHTFVGDPGNNYIRIFRPRVSGRIYRNINLAYEYFLYKRDDTNGPLPTIRVKTHEQRLYLLFDF